MLIQLSKIMGLLKGDRRAVTALEYALMGSLIALAIIGAATSLGTKIGTTFNDIATALTNTGSSINTSSSPGTSSNTSSSTPPATSSSSTSH